MPKPIETTDYTGPSRRINGGDRRAEKQPAVAMRIAIQSLAVIFGALAFVLVATVTVVAIVGQHGLELNRQVGRCVLDELVEHRASSVTHEAQSAIEHHDVFTQPLDIQPPSQAAVEAARRNLAKDCAPFLPKGISNPEPVYVPRVVTTLPAPTTTTSVSPPVNKAPSQKAARRSATTSSPLTTSTTRPRPASTTTTTRPPSPPTTSCPVPFTPCPVNVNEGGRR